LRTQHHCLPCFLRQTIDTVSLALDDEKLQREAIGRIMAFMQTIDYSTPPPLIGKEIYSLISTISGNPDPYKEIKRKYNLAALAVYDDLRRLVYRSSDPLEMAAKLSVAGNIIDFGTAGKPAEIGQLLENIAQLEFRVNHFRDFITSLLTKKNILYLADNAGEIVFDRLFIEMLLRFYPEKNLKIRVVVRGAPIINDATMEDAEMVGLTRIVPVMSNGDSAPATDLKQVNAETLRAFDEADMIISKGQGNYETLDMDDRLIYFLLQVKCPAIAGQFSAPEGSLIFQRNPKFQAE